MNRRPVNFAIFFCDNANIHWLTKEASDKCSGEEHQTHLSKILHLAKAFPLSIKHQILGSGSSPSRTLDIISVTPSQRLFFPVFLRILLCHAFPSQWQNVEMEQYEVFSTNKYTDPTQHRVINAQDLAAQKWCIFHHQQVIKPQVYKLLHFTRDCLPDQTKTRFNIQ